MGVNRVISTRVTSVVLIHTQVLLATRGSLRDPFTEKLVDVKNDIFVDWKKMLNLMFLSFLNNFESLFFDLLTVATASFPLVQN